MSLKPSRSGLSFSASRSCRTSCSIFFVFIILRQVPLAFLNNDLVAERHLVANPFRHVFGCRVKIHHVVDVGVVELFHDYLLDVREVDNHSVIVESLALAENGHKPVMAVKVAALARIREFQTVRSRNFQSLAYSIHCFLLWEWAGRNPPLKRNRLLDTDELVPLKREKPAGIFLHQLYAVIEVFLDEVVPVEAWAKAHAFRCLTRSRQRVASLYDET